MSTTGFVGAACARDVEPAAELLQVVGAADEGARDHGADDEREDDEREHRERHPGAEPVPKRVGNRHPQDRREGTDPPDGCGEASEEDVGVVDQRPRRAQHDEEPAQDPDSEAPLQLFAGQRLHRVEGQEPHHDQQSPAAVNEPLREPSGPGERDGADHHERNAEHERGGVRCGEAGEREQDAEYHRQRPGDPAPLPRLGLERLRRIPDRRHDVQAAHPEAESVTITNVSSTPIP